MAYCLFRRHVWARRGIALAEGIARIAALGSIGLSVWVLSGVPFGLGPSGLLDFYGQASNSYEVTSVWAFNLWGVAGFWKGDVPGAVFPLMRVAGVPAFTVGMVLFVATTAWVLVRAHRSISRGHSEARVIATAAAALAAPQPEAGGQVRRGITRPDRRLSAPRLLVLRRCAGTRAVRPPKFPAPLSRAARSATRAADRGPPR